MAASVDPLKYEKVCFTENCRKFPKPKIFCSRCITFENCRWNGQIIASKEVERLKPYVDFITNCPEKEIGLGVPRDSIRLAKVNGITRLIQPTTNKDVTDDMIEYAKQKFEIYRNVDGFILKNKSPSCGIDEVRVYDSPDSKSATEKARGVFGQCILTHFTGRPITDEGRLYNVRIWENFLTQIYMVAEFRNAKSIGTTHALIEFHTHEKMLLMAYNQALLHEMGNLLGNQEKKPIEDVFRMYEELFYRAIAEMPEYTAQINVLQHAMGYFKEKISAGEKQFFLMELENYRTGRIPLSVLIHILRSWIIRFDEPYLLQQYYFQPFPDELDLQENFFSNKEKDKRLGN
jgi:uncharacterized protein YbgA (DUF1722 family)/uncharacterized protein YbbK (DUF523 family)